MIESNQAYQRNDFEDPEKKTVINRYRIINHEKDYLLILSERSKDRSMIWLLLGILAFAGMMIYLFITDIQKWGYNRNSNIFMIISSVLLIVAGLIFYKMQSTKARWLFTKEELVERTDFGRIFKVKRAAVRSVYIEKTNNFTNGSYTGSEYRVALSYKNGQVHQLLYIEKQNIKQTFLGDLLTTDSNNRNSEALQIATIIGNYWNIPVSI